MREETRTDGTAPGEHPSSIAERTMPTNIKQRSGTRLEISAGEPDLEALRLVTREWLVPLLVENFLRDQALSCANDSNAKSKKY